MQNVYRISIIVALLETNIVIKDIYKQLNKQYKVAQNNSNTDIH